MKTEPEKNDNAVRRGSSIASGPRSKISLLPFAVRFRIYSLVQDGSTLANLLADPEVAAALDARGITLNSANLTRLRASKEYREVAARREARNRAEYDDHLCAALLRDSGSAEEIADGVKVSLLRSLQQLSDVSEMEDPEARVKALRSITASVSAISATQKDKTIMAREKEIAALQEKLRAAAEKIDELQAKVRELGCGKKESAGLTPEALSAVEEKIKLL